MRTHGRPALYRWSVAPVLSIVIASLVFLVQPHTVAAQAPIPLDVPYISQMYCQWNCTRQFENYNGQKNCGPASLGMVIDANGKRDVNDDQAFVRRVWTRMAGREPYERCHPGMFRTQLDDGASAYGLALGDELSTVAQFKQKTDKCYPVIAWINGAELVSVWDRAPSMFGTIDHIVVVTGVDSNYVYVNDPLRFKETGCAGTKPVTKCDPEVFCAEGPYKIPKKTFEVALTKRKTKNKWAGKVYGSQIANCDAPPDPGGGSGADPDEVFDEIKVRLAHHCGYRRDIQLFYIAGDDTDFTELASRKEYPRGDGNFRELSFKFNYGYHPDHFKGTLKKLRLDAPNDEPSCLVGVSYIYITNSDGDSGNWPEWWFSPDSHQPQHPRKGWWRTRLNDRLLPGTWAMDTTGLDAFITETNVGFNTGR